jgi:hypothetical protein
MEITVQLQSRSSMRKVGATLAGLRPSIPRLGFALHLGDTILPQRYQGRECGTSPQEPEVGGAATLQASTCLPACLWQPRLRNAS